jgi:hypothetical protein
MVAVRTAAPATGLSRSGTRWGAEHLPMFGTPERLSRWSEERAMTLCTRGI